MSQSKPSKAQLERNVTEEQLVTQLLANAVRIAIERRRARGLEIAVWADGSVTWKAPAGADTADHTKDSRGFGAED